MGVRTRGLDMKAGFRRDAADKARAEAEGPRSRHAVVADDPGGADRRHAVAGRLLPRLRHEPRNRSQEIDGHPLVRHACPARRRAMMVDRTPEIATLLRHKPAAAEGRIQGIGRHSATEAAARRPA
jgi:hypothetical protein